MTEFTPREPHPCNIRAAFQVSNDGLTWHSGVASAGDGTFSVFETALTADGIDYGTTFLSTGVWPPAEKKQWVRFGVAAYNASAGVPEACLASIRVDTRKL